jgi:hypothetical protein
VFDTGSGSSTEVEDNDGVGRRPVAAAMAARAVVIQLSSRRSADSDGADRLIRAMIAPAHRVGR